MPMSAEQKAVFAKLSNGGKPPMTQSQKEVQDAKFAKWKDAQDMEVLTYQRMCAPYINKKYSAEIVVEEAVQADGLKTFEVGGPGGKITLSDMITEATTEPTVANGGIQKGRKLITNKRLQAKWDKNARRPARIGDRLALYGASSPRVYWDNSGSLYDQGGNYQSKCGSYFRPEYYTGLKKEKEPIPGIVQTSSEDLKCQIAQKIEKISFLFNTTVAMNKLTVKQNQRFSDAIRFHGQRAVDELIGLDSQSANVVDFKKAQYRSVDGQNQIDGPVNLDGKFQDVFSGVVGKIELEQDEIYAKNHALHQQRGKIAKRARALDKFCWSIDDQESFSAAFEKELIEKKMTREQARKRGVSLVDCPKDDAAMQLREEMEIDIVDKDTFKDDKGAEVTDPLDRFPTRMEALQKREAKKEVAVTLSCVGLMIPYQNPISCYSLKQKAPEESALERAQKKLAGEMELEAEMAGPI